MNLNLGFEEAWKAISAAFHPSVVSQPVGLLHEGDPLTWITIETTLLILTIFFLSLIRDWYSYVDRLWSLLPIAWVGTYLVKVLFLSKSATHSISARLVVMFLCVLIWGSRLTFNFARKGGYSDHGEDYRWAILKERISSPFLWQIFNIGFICIAQLILIWAFSSSIDVAYRHSSTPFNTLDYIATVLMLSLIVMESIADEQMWAFQERKRKNPKGKEAKIGFITTGLFSYSRHPNFFAEIFIWWSFYLFSVASSGNYINWTIFGPAFLTLLFQGSTNFTEKLSANKYSQYAEYQQTTSRLIPWIPGEEIVPQQPTFENIELKRIHIHKDNVFMNAPLSPRRTANSGGSGTTTKLNKSPGPKSPIVSKSAAEHLPTLDEKLISARRELEQTPKAKPQGKPQAKATATPSKSNAPPVASEAPAPKSPKVRSPKAKKQAAAEAVPAVPPPRSPKSPKLPKSPSSKPPTSAMKSPKGPRRR